MELKDGLANATHIHSAPWTPNKAFLPDQPHAWINGENQRRLLAMIWIEFPANKAFIPGRISFRPRQDCCLDEAPTVQHVYGFVMVVLAIYKMILS